MKKNLLKRSTTKKRLFPRMAQNVICLLLLSTTTLTFAQVPGFEDDVNDEVPPAASIDSSLLLFSFMAAGLGIYFTKKNEKTIRD